MMSSKLFRVEEHVVPCQHIREYARATAYGQEDVLHLAVKQYIPLDNLTPKPGDITIIGAHANGFPKELYEPLWEEILVRAGQHNFRIRSIWIADFAVQGQSGILNEKLMGNDPSWNDHPRDLLHLINVKRDQMPRPIIGIGHSLGGNNLAALSLMHPRLFTTLLLLDPVIQSFASNPPDGKPSPFQLSTFRRDIWPSRKAAADSFRKSKFYQAWDPRVLERWIAYGLRDLPTPAYPDDPLTGGERKVTLTTTKDQEVFTFARPNYEGSGHEGAPVNRQLHPDLDPIAPVTYPFYRPEPLSVITRLPELRPSVLYIFGGKSPMSSPQYRKIKMEITGIGANGSGGARDGRVKEVVLEEIGHLVAMEAVTECADAASEWIGAEMSRWRADEEEFQKMWSQMSQREKSTIDKKWMDAVGGPPGKNAPGKGTPKL